MFGHISLGSIYLQINKFKNKNNPTIKIEIIVKPCWFFLADWFSTEASVIRFCFLSQAKEKYEKSLEELNKCTPQYMESMEQVFDQCQQHEVKRLTFLKEALLDIKRHLNLTENPRSARLKEPVLFRFHRAAGLGSLTVFSLTYDW